MVIVDLVGSARPLWLTGSRYVESDNGAVSSVFKWCGRCIRNAVAAASFWLAVALPTLYLPLLAIGLEPAPVARAFGTLLIVHACAIVVSHRYRPERDTGDEPTNEIET